MRDEVERILLVRPAVEAGERLGFLFGDLAQKVDPYLRPLYDALHEMLGFETVAKLQERNVIEIAPWPTCAEERSMVHLSCWMRARIPPASR